MEEVCENCKHCFIDIDGDALFCMHTERITDYGDSCGDFEERTEAITQREPFWDEVNQED